MRLRRSFRPQSVTSWPYPKPRKKACLHFEAVADAAHRVVQGDLAPSRQAAMTLAEEYLLLHLEFKALMTHLGDE